MCNEFYVAELGGGAWCNEQRIHVSASGRLVEAVLACGIPCASKPDHPMLAREMALLTEVTAGIHRPGTFSVDMDWVSTVRWDDYGDHAPMASGHDTGVY